MSDRVFGGIGLLLGVFFIWQATFIPLSFISDPIGPKTFPIILGVVLSLSSVAIMLLPGGSADWPGMRTFAELSSAVAVLIAYSFVLPLVGFVVSTIFAAFYLCLRLGAPLKGAAIGGVSISLGIYALFHLVLGLSLARGPWGF